MRNVSFTGAAAVLSLAMMANGSAAQDGWGGFYLGVLAGSNSTDFHWDEAGGLGTFDGEIDTNSRGLFAGYNVQRNQLVYGIEAEASSFSGGAEFTGVPGPDDFSANPDSEVVIKGRIGYDQGKVMPYLAVGYSWMKLATDSICCGTDDGKHQGVVAAVGADFALTNNLFGRIEYTHSWLSEERYIFCGGGCETDITLGESSLHLGLGYRF